MLNQQVVFEPSMMVLQIQNMSLTNVTVVMKELIKFSMSLDQLGMLGTFFKIVIVFSIGDVKLQSYVVRLTCVTIC